MSSDQKKDPFFEIVQGFSDTAFLGVPEAELTPLSNLEEGLRYALQVGVKAGGDRPMLVSDYCSGVLSIIYDPEISLEDKSVTFRSGHMFAQTARAKGLSTEDIKGFVEEQKKLLDKPEVLDGHD